MAAQQHPCAKCPFIKTVASEQHNELPPPPPHISRRQYLHSFSSQAVPHLYEHLMACQEYRTQLPLSCVFSVVLLTRG